MSRSIISRARKLLAEPLRRGTTIPIEDGPDRSQRIWYEPSGEKIEKWRDIRAEISDEAKGHKYTYRIVLSQEQGHFGPEHYRADVRS